MTTLAELTDAELDERFTALIRKKHPYQPNPTRRDAIKKLSAVEERELWECAIESNRRERLQLRRKHPPRQLLLFGETTP